MEKTSEQELAIKVEKFDDVAGVSALVLLNNESLIIKRREADTVRFVLMVGNLLYLPHTLSQRAFKQLVDEVSKTTKKLTIIDSSELSESSQAVFELELKDIPIGEDGTANTDVLTNKELGDLVILHRILSSG